MTDEVDEMSAASRGSVANGSLMQGMQQVADEVASWSKDKYEFMKEFLPPVDCLVDAKHDPVGPTSGDRIRGKKLGGSK